MVWFTALALNLFVAIGFSAFGLWKFSRLEPPSGFSVASLALGLSLTMLVSLTFGLYAATSLRLLREVGAHLAVPALVFVAVTIYAIRRRKVSVRDALPWAVAGFLALWFVGLYGALLVACSFGDCL